MKFSKGEISKDGNEISINYQYRKKSESITFNRDDYKEYATHKKKFRANINRWVLFLSLLMLLIAWISLSEYIGNRKSQFSVEDYAFWRKFDMPIALILMILTFVTLFTDIIANMKAMRVLFALPFTSRQWMLIIILESNKEIEIPIRNKKEAIELIEFIKTNLKD